MKKILLIFILLLNVCCVTAQHTVTITIENLPSEPRGYDLYLAGSFNGWRPADDNFMFQRKGNGQFFIELRLAAGNYEYKITRGGWDKVECTKTGVSVANRTLQVHADTSFNVDVEEWQDNFKPVPKKNTASKNVKIIDTAFWIPQLNRKRRVWIYLPASYSTNKKSRFPVLYMHDGQNVFDDATSFAGEWGVDEFLDSAKTKQCIVVAIDNGGDKRLNEYCPYDFNVKTSRTDSLKGKGEGNEYADFLVNTLKPYIDKNYRTKKDRANTFIAGSSMGGLISLYAVLKYPKIFGGAGIFSPAFWVAPGLFETVRKTDLWDIRTRLYFYAGGSESQSMVPDMQKVAGDFEMRCECGVKIKINDKGQHNEPTWRNEFPDFYRWLMGR